MISHDNENYSLKNDNPFGNEDRIFDLAGTNILLIEGRINNTSPLILIAEELGCDVKILNHAAVFEDAQPLPRCDLVLLDLQGVTQKAPQLADKTLHQIKSWNCPLILIARDPTHPQIIESIKPGAIDVLAPPFHRQLVETRLRQALASSIAYHREHQLRFAYQKTRQYLEMVIEGLEAGFALFDNHKTLLLSNKTFQKLYGLDANIDASRLSLQSFLQSNFAKHIYGPERRKVSQKKAENQEQLKSWLELRLHQYSKGRSYVERLQDGRWVEVTNSLTPDGGIITLHKDVTSYKNAERQLEYLAWHDPLTGLVNRGLFEAKLQAIFSTYPHNKRQFAVLYLDLDDFKAINDQWGHDFGDAILKVTAQNLQQALREGDTVARIGGDEFAILLPSFEQKKDIEEVARRIIRKFNKGFVYQNQTVSIGISIGIVVCPDLASDLAACLKYSDLAMYKAKRQGKSQYHFFKKSDLLQSLKT